MSQMRGTILRREILFETADSTRSWRIWLGKWDEDAVRAVEDLWMFSHRDSYGGDWANILFKDGRHIIPADEFETAVLLWLDANSSSPHHLFTVQLWDLFWGVSLRKDIFKRAWQWFISHKAELEQNPFSTEHHFLQILRFLPE